MTEEAQPFPDPAISLLTSNQFTVVRGGRSLPHALIHFLCNPGCFQRYSQDVKLPLVDFYIH